MAKHGKNYRKVADKCEKGKVYDLQDAVAFLKKNSFTKFDETVEMAFNLGVDPTKSDQMVRGTVSLPNGTGKDVKVIVFATGDAAEQAKEAGADEVGLEELIAKVKGGWFDFDIAISTQEAMKEVRVLGKQLGPRQLMPNPKSGTITDDTATAVKQFKAGRVEFKMDRNGNLMVPFGKLSFDVEKLVENAEAVLDSVMAAKPSSAKGAYVRRCTVTSTMGPGLEVSPRKLATV